MNKLRNRHVIWFGIATGLLICNIGFIVISLPIYSAVLIDYILCKTKNNEEIKKVPLDESLNIDELRAVIEKIEEKNEEEKNYRKNVDIRQFKNRKDVTKEEVEDFLWIHYFWEGMREKQIILEEIRKVCNLNQEESKEILNNHIKKGGCWIRNEEEKRIRLYEIKKVKEKDEKYNKEFERIENWMEKNIPQRKTKKYEMDERHKYIFYYEDWLKEKGYV